MLPYLPESPPHLAESLSSGLPSKVTSSDSQVLTVPLPPTPGLWLTLWCFSSYGPCHPLSLSSHLHTSLFNAWVPTDPGLLGACVW